VAAGEPPPSHPRPVRHLASAIVSPDSYGSVLVLILVTYALSVTLTQTWARSAVLLVQIGTVWLALHVSGARRPVRQLATALLALAGVVALANLVWDRDDLATTVVFMTSALLYFIAPLSILRAIVMQREVSLETVLGAIDAYLLIGMFFAYVYQGMGASEPAPFFEGGIDGTVAQSLFFSFTTLTTTGYGNLVPAGNPGQTFAVLEMLIGQLFLITAVAKVIDAWRPARWRPADGSPPADTGTPTP
jgi:hypothetical protein